VLSYLSVSNFSVIESLSIDLDKGLNIITGETGAGKSVLIGAVKLLLGERFNKSMIRDESKKVRIEGIFNGDFNFLDDELKEDFEIEDEILIRREVDIKGKNKIYINGILATLKELKKITSNLIDIHGQHEHQKLFNSKYHLDYIDSMLDAALLEEYRGLFEKYSEKNKELRNLKENLSTFLKEKDIYEFQIKEIEEMNIDIEKESEIDEKIKYLSNLEKINENLSFSLNLLSESDYNLCDNLNKVISKLSEISDYSKELETVYKRLDEINYEIIDCREIVSDLIFNAETDTSELDTLMQRKYKLDKLCKKYGGTLNSVIEYKNEIKNKLDCLVFDEENISVLEVEISELKVKLIKLISKINTQRLDVAKKLSSLIEKVLYDLDLKNTSFEVRFNFFDEPDKNASAEAEFFISTNIGFEPAPLATVASGGEISRVMLALKEIFNKADNIHTMIFDEIDTGISGKTAEKVGEKLSNLAVDNQLIVITHLPVVAAKGNVHFHIYKEVENNVTITKIKELDKDTREKVIATMISGKVSDTSLAGACELLKGN
jgi:DNA repair protein RecN (Recombination protein N)